MQKDQSSDVIKRSKALEIIKTWEKKIIESEIKQDESTENKNKN